MTGQGIGAWGAAETRFFYELTPDRILDAVEAAGLRPTGRCYALNSMENRVYDVEIEIVEFVRDRRIAWTIHGQIQPPIGHVYGYDLEPVAHDEGPATMVTSFYDWSRIDPVWRERDIFPIIPESALRATLGILARNVAPGRPRPLLD